MRNKIQILVSILMLALAALVYALVNHFRPASNNLTSRVRNVGTNIPRQLNKHLRSDDIIVSPVDYQPPLARAEVTPEVEGKALGKLSPFKLGNNPGSARFAPPTPEIWLEFFTLTENSTAINVQLPSKVKRVLQEHWQAACAYYYSERTGENAHLSRVERMMVLADATEITLCRLEKLSIHAPGGQRLISKNESLSIVSRLNQFAKDLL